MSEDPEALRELVDKKAEDLKRDLEELGDRVVTQPRAAIESKISTARRFYAPVASFVRRQPAVATVVAAGLGFAVGFFL